MSAPARTQLEGLGLSSNCVDVLRHLWDYLDDELTPRGAERLRAHIASCAQCREYEGYQECFLDTLAKLREQIGAPDGLRTKLAEKLKGQGCGCWNKVRRERS
ncbi:MAG: zf-HC2 domain-containing protein [bacterium]